jgi:hypothetical protein
MLYNATSTANKEEGAWQSEQQQASWRPKNTHDSRPHQRLHSIAVVWQHAVLDINQATQGRVTEL